MKTSWLLFIGLSIFYAIMTVIYWQLGGEPVGITAIALSGGLALIVGFYLWFTARRLGNVLPEDNQPLPFRIRLLSYRLLTHQCARHRLPLLCRIL